MRHFHKQHFVLFSLFLLAGSFYLPASVRAESISLQSDDAVWISNMIFKNECDRKTDCLISWNEGEDFLSLGIGHFIWYLQGRTDRYQESFPDFLVYLESEHEKIPEEIKLLIQNGTPWKTREEFLAAQSGENAEKLRDFLGKTMEAQALYMVRRFQQAVLQMIPMTPLEQRAVLTEKIFSLSQSRQGLYAMIDYLNFKGDGLSPQERYRAHGWGLFQVFYEMAWPTGEEGIEFEFVKAAHKVLRRRVDNAPAERREERWIEGWVKRVETYSSMASSAALVPQTEHPVVFTETSGSLELFKPSDLAV